MASNISNNVTYINLLEQYFATEVAAYILHSFYMSIGVWCVVANSFLLTVLVKFDALHTHANIFVANIAASDLCLGVSNIIMRPFTFNRHATLGTARTACLIFTFFVVFVQLNSIHALFCATCERYIKICHPFKYERVMKTKIILPMIILCWIISILHGCMITGARWSPDALCKLISIIDRPNLIACIPYFIILLTCLCFFNFKIFGTVLKHRQQIQDQFQSLVSTEHVQRTKLIGVIVLFTFLGYIPYVVSLITGFFINEEKKAYRIADTVTIMLMYANNVVNPVIFGWKDQNIRKYAKKILMRN